LGVHLGDVRSAFLSSYLGHISSIWKFTLLSSGFFLFFLVISAHRRGYRRKTLENNKLKQQ